MRHKISYVFVVLFAFLLIFVSSKFVLAIVNTAPSILFLTQVEGAGSSQILVNGLIAPGYDVKIYLNGKYDGMANVSQITTDFAKFSYLSAPINSSQKYELMAIGQNKVSLELTAPAISAVNSVIEQSVLAPAKKITTVKTKTVATIVAAPALISPTMSPCVAIPYVSGSTPSGTSVNIFIDNNLSATIPSTKVSSSVSLFSYLPANILKRGIHSVYAIAQNNNGVKSSKSNTLNFCINVPQILTATSTSDAQINNIPTSSPIITAQPTSTTIFQKTIANSTASNNKNILNIIVFLLFVIGLLIWMIFVNRELAQENDENNQDNDIKQ